MNGFLYPGILLLLTLAGLSFAFVEDPYNGVVGEDDDGNAVGQDYGDPQVDEWPRRRQGGTKRQGAQCRAKGECSGYLNCCRTTGSSRTQCGLCRGRNQACQRQTDCAHPCVCSQKIDPRTRRPRGSRRCVALNLNRPPADEQIVGRRPGK